MDQMTPTTPTGERKTLRRARKERILFGVCGGLAHYFDLDPTLVRVAFALIGLIPPLGGTLVIAYAILTLIVPEEGAEPQTGRDQVKGNLAGLRGEFGSLRDEVSGLAETIRAKVTREPSASATIGGARPAHDAASQSAAPAPSTNDTTRAAA